MIKKELADTYHYLVLTTLFITLLVSVILISSISYSIAENVYHIFRSVDPDNCFLLLSVHHIVQAIIALFLIWLISKATKRTMADFGFNKNKLKYSIKAVLVFCGIWSVIQAAGSIFVLNHSAVPAAFAFLLTRRNFLGYFLFEILLTGPSEEILFRSLVIPPVHIMSGFLKSERRSNFVSVSAATIIFMLAHINFNLNPFQITHINPLQQITCLIFGVFFGYLFVKTKSVIGPMLAHSTLNGIITVITLIVYNTHS